MRILIIEDDKSLAETLRFQLEQNHFETDVCHDGEEGLHFIEQKSHDLILLDRMLPILDGISVLKITRAKNISTPIIFVTALGALNDKITGLDCGADDYLVKPFDFEELLARIRCILRRPSKWEGGKPLEFEDISYDIQQKKLYCKDLSCSLSAREGDLLEFFLRNPQQTIPRASLLSKVWGPDSDVEDGNLDNYVYFLRRRLKTVKSSVQLRTVRGVGYQLEVSHV
ncbi:MAG: response regulator transcription factor [Lachnospiraceae bacterium]|nr:response regulator transcription factor [Lachnospiraceae bacterium]